MPLPVPEYFYKQSGVIPYRMKEGKLEILLVTSTKKKKWIIPKGVIEPELSPQESAVQEAYEEAGVIGRAWDEPVGEFKVEKWQGVCNITVFPMLVIKVIKDWQERDFRKRKWCSPKEAIEKLENPDVKALVKKFSDEFDYRGGI